MMRDTQEPAPFESWHRQRLRSGVRSRQRVRVVQRAVGSALVVAGLGIGFLLLPRDPVEDRPQAPFPRPAMSPAAPTMTPTRPPDTSPPGSSTASPPTETADPTATPTGNPTVEVTVGPSGTPTVARSSDTVSSGPSVSSTTTLPPSSDSGATHTPSAPATTPSNVGSSASEGSADAG